MSRYFDTTNASLPIKIGSNIFTFEPIEIMGGAWYGVLKIDDPGAADLLAAHKGPVSEISAEDYESVKKKSLPREPKPKRLQIHSLEAIQRHQVSQGVSPADQLESPGQESSKSSVGAATNAPVLDITVEDVEIIDDLADIPAAPKSIPPSKQSRVPSAA